MSTVDPAAEDNDQYPDFRLLLSGNSKGQQALPTKEAKASQGSAAALGDDASTTAALLNEQYDAYFQILKEERRAAERTYSRAVYEPERGLFRLTANRGTHFVSMGHTIKGQIYLYPEEALYLTDRGSLLIDYQGATMTLQRMWSVYLSPASICADQDVLGDGIGSRSDFNRSTTRSSDATGSMERYLTYSYLKRLGFVVTRPRTYDNALDSANTKTKKNSKDSALTAATNETSLPQDRQAKAEQDQRGEQGVVSLRSPLLTLLVNTWDQFTVGIRKWWHIKRFLWSGGARRPIISSSDRIPIEQILPKLQIVPDLRLASKTDVSNSKSMKPSVDFFVYKPAGAFTKRKPGNPDYRVVVIRCWRVHDKYLCSVDKKHFEEFHVYYQKCNSCPHDRAHCGNLIMEREASKLFPWRCNVCAQQEFMDKTGRYKTEDFSRW